MNAFTGACTQSIACGSARWDFHPSQAEGEGPASQLCNRATYTAETPRWSELAGGRAATC